MAVKRKAVREEAALPRHWYKCEVIVPGKQQRGGMTGRGLRGGVSGQDAEQVLAEWITAGVVQSQLRDEGGGRGGGKEGGRGGENDEAVRERTLLNHHNITHKGYSVSALEKLIISRFTTCYAVCPHCVTAVIFITIIIVSVYMCMLGFVCICVEHP